MARARCHRSWPGECPAGTGQRQIPHKCARPPGHDPVCMCYCGTRARELEAPAPAPVIIRDQMTLFDIA
jgi:hypothetical protein